MPAFIFSDSAKITPDSLGGYSRDFYYAFSYMLIYEETRGSKLLLSTFVVIYYFNVCTFLTYFIFSLLITLGKLPLLVCKTYEVISLPIDLWVFVYFIVYLFVYVMSAVNS